MEHLALCITDIALELGEKRDGCCHGHALEHVFLPVLVQRVRFTVNLCREVALDDGTLVLVGHHSQYSCPEAVYGFAQGFAASCPGSEHNLVGCLKVILALYVVYVTVRAVGFLDDSYLEVLREVVK